jgi:NAD(P)-dependent dehydrogenase (short-subunit alcohol dehydrogenase family)
MNRFAGRVAVVTGGASGIGFETAVRLAAEGASIALLDFDQAGAARAAAELEGKGHNVRAYTVDVTGEASVNNAIDTVARDFGRLDVLIKCAGIAARGTLEQTEFAEWRRVLDVDLTSIYLTSRAAIGHFRGGGGGAIVNIASLAGMFGVVNVAYVAAKGGVISLTQQLANELAADKVRVNAVSPGFVSTALNRELRAQGAEARWERQIPLGRYAHAREIAAACAFLASDDASYMTGANVVVDGGLGAVLRPDPVAA